MTIARRGIADRWRRPLTKWVAPKIRHRRVNEFPDQRKGNTERLIIQETKSTNNENDFLRFRATHDGCSSTHSPAHTRTHTQPMHRKSVTKCIFDVQIVFIKSILVSSHYIIANKAARAFFRSI